MDYFTLFSLPVDYRLNVEQLTQHYQALQKQYHPDQAVTQSSQQRLHHLQQASLINEAYQVLKHPLQRAQYYLSLQGVAFESQRTIADQAFLTEQLALHEQLAQLRKQQDLSGLLAFEAQIEQKIADYTQQMYDALDQKNWPIMATQVTKLQFFSRIQQQIEQAQEHFLQ